MRRVAYSAHINRPQCEQVVRPGEFSVLSFPEQVNFADDLPQPGSAEQPLSLGLSLPPRPDGPEHDPQDHRQPGQRGNQDPSLSDGLPP